MTSSSELGPRYSPVDSRRRQCRWLSKRLAEDSSKESILGSISCLTRDTLAVRGYKNTDTPKPPFYLGFLPSVNPGLPIHIGRSAISSVSFAWLKIFNPMIPL
ncbi:hypothetical protein E4T50_03401 [Aureobasidium sp. EXF-12298]|nr:hypothetical protein E4T50_03401 [Aureobasidium sp. EXF-12298]